MTVTQQNVQDTYKTQGDYRLTKLILSSFDKSKSIDLRPQFTDLTLYEDMFESSIYGSLSIIDSIGLVSGKVTGFPLLGEEWLELEFYVPGRDMINLQLFVHHIQPISYDEKQSQMHYTLDFCSIEHLADANTLIQKSYNKPVSDIVSDIVTNYLKSSKTFTVDPSLGSQALIIPNMTPYEAIEFLRKRAVSQSYKGNSYLFFENKRGLYFTTIEKLFDDFSKVNNDPTYTYTFDPQISGDSPIPMTTLKNIIHMQYSKTFDTVEKLKKGYFNSNTLTLSPLTQSWTNKTNGIGDLSTYTTMNGNAPNTSGFMKAYTNGSKFIYKIYDASLPDTHADILEGPRSFFMTALAQRMITCYCSGDTNIHAGDVIFLDISEIHGFTPRQDNHDKTRAGKYIIGTIKHTLDKQNYFMTMDGFQLDVPNSVG